MYNNKIVTILFDFFKTLTKVNLMNLKNIWRNFFKNKKLLFKLSNRKKFLINKLRKNKFSKINGKKKLISLPIVTDCAT
jgi:hypothetical protein